MPKLDHGVTAARVQDARRETYRLLSPMLTDERKAMLDALLVVDEEPASPHRLRSCLPRNGERERARDRRRAVAIVEEVVRRAVEA